MKKKNTFYSKAKRIFSPLRKYAWIFTLLVAVGGLFYPKLGLLVIPVMISLTLIALFKGRFWCGNVCSHGSFFDSIIFPFSRNSPIPGLFKSKITIGIFFLLFMTKLVTKFIQISSNIGSGAFLDKAGLIFVASYLMVAIAGGILALTFSPRTWCNFCPMGVMQTFSYKIGRLLKINRKTDEKVSVSSMDMCRSCGKCSRACPMQLVPHKDFSENNQFDNENCIRCKTCVYHCPVGILSLNTEEAALKNRTEIDGQEKKKSFSKRA